VTCPKCAADVEPLPVGFTWWGGFVGPKMLKHVECPACHARFNGETGTSNEGAIRLYIAIITLAVIMVMIGIWSSIR
jgi:hypothetical protein